MQYKDYEIEYIVKQILNRLGKKREIKAGIVYSHDNIDGKYVSGYVKVDGLEYSLDKLLIYGYYYNFNYYFTVRYGNIWISDEPFGAYVKSDDGTIYNKNEHIWETYLLEVYQLLDDLERNEKAKKSFFENYGSIIPWPQKTSLGSCEEIRENYIRELDIDLIVEVYFNWVNADTSEEKFKYKIYDGPRCVYDSEANIFIDGPWKDKLIRYSLAKKENKEKERVLKKEKAFNDSLQKLRSIRNNGDNR